MSRHEVLDALTQVLDGLGPVALGMRCYHFGSSSRKDGESPRDVDVLLVYPSGRLSDAHEAAEAIRDSDHRPRFDVLALSEAEAGATDFIAEQGAHEIAPRQHPDARID